MVDKFKRSIIYKYKMIMVLDINFDIKYIKFFFLGLNDVFIYNLSLMFYNLFLFV